MDLAAVRTFVAVADTGQFLRAAAELSVTQQAISKRVAALEKELGVRLFTRTHRGARLTLDGQAFLLQEFHRAHPGVELDVVTLADGRAAIGAVHAGSIDAAIRAVPVPARELPDGVEAARVLDEPIQLLTGPDHVLASAGSVRPGVLAGHRIWMPGIVTGTEWAAYYAELATAFGLDIDAVGPDFGIEPLLDALADSPALATFVGEGTRLLWPAGYDLRRVSLRDPVPVYPHSLLWRADNPHPALSLLRDHLTATRDSGPGTPAWAPHWAAP